MTYNLEAKLKENIEKRAEIPKFQKLDIVHYNSEQEERAMFWLVTKSIKNNFVKILPFKVRKLTSNLANEILQSIANYQYVVDRAENPVYENQDNLELANVKLIAASDGFQIGLAEYNRVLRISMYSFLSASLTTNSISL